MRLKTKNFKFQNIIAGVTVVAVIIFMYIWMMPDKDWQGIKVNTGSIDSIQLPDNSMAYLAGPSELGYPKIFDDKVKKVKMEGEVYFEIAPTPDKTFLVQAEIGGIETRGAKFLMNTIKNKRITVHCFEGSTRLIVRGKVEILEITLEKNEMCDFIRGDKKISKQTFDPATLESTNQFLADVRTPTH